MKIINAFSLLLLLAFTALPFDGARGPTSIIVTPRAPKFSDAERHAELARRRTAVAAKMEDNSVIVLFSAEHKLYTNDVDYVFRQENNLYYLTALKQAGATLVITKKGGKVTETVYLPKRNPQFETWNGKMYSNEDAARISGIAIIADATTRPAFLDGLKAKNDPSVQTVYLLLPGSERDSNGMREFRVENDFSKQLAGQKVVNAQPIFAELRQIKSPYELKLLQHAVDISIEGHMRTWATVGAATMEYEVQAEFEYTLRRRNADFWGYPSIVGCGPNATTLHYEESQGPVTKGSLLLIDAAAEYEHYSADVTRTFPVNGKFTKEQAEVYQIVYDAQEAAARLIKPGATMQQISAAAASVIKDGLAKLGLIEAPNATYKVVTADGTVDVPQYRIWYMHGLGHWLGMNVHDVGRSGALKAGMVFTNEPGIYVREDALDYLADTPENRAFKEKVRSAFEKYKTIGVRIEDDMLVTETGVQWMTAKLPRSMKDIEVFMAAKPAL